MDILYIFGLTILLTGGAGSLIEDEDSKADKNLQQRILLRKLQNFQETKPVTWNEILADVLVNKIRIFSFSSQDKEDVTKNDAPVSNENTVLTNFFSKALVVYKKFIYDTFVGKRKANDGESIHLATVEPKSVEIIPKKIPEEVINPTKVTFADGPKSEVELIEPKYHGKITAEHPTQNPETDNFDHNNNEKATPDAKETSNTEVNNAEPNVQASLDSGLQETAVNCAEGFVKSDGGDCVKNISRLILAVPNQCPNGYRKDWLGYCRKVFNF